MTRFILTINVVVVAAAASAVVVVMMMMVIVVVDVAIVTVVLLTLSQTVVIVVPWLSDITERQCRACRRCNDGINPTIIMTDTLTRAIDDLDGCHEWF
jgi:hypothetical protein